MPSPLPPALLTEPVNGYIIVTRCKDPQEAFEKPGKIIVKLTTEAIQQDPVGIPAMVMSVDEKDNKHGLAPGDVVYLLHKFGFGVFCDGSMFIVCHQDHILAKLPRAK